MGPPLWRGRRGTPDGEAIRGGVHGAASRVAERIMRKDSRPLFVVHAPQNSFFIPLNPERTR